MEEINKKLLKFIIQASSTYLILRHVPSIIFPCGDILKVTIILSLMCLVSDMYIPSIHKTFCVHNAYKDMYRKNIYNA